jgi:RNA polymerase sigma factor (sigma-70 family)
MKDRLLVLGCKRGSREAFCRIYEKYKRDLLILAIALLNDASAAEDVLHDVFLAFVRDIQKFRLSGSLKGYLAVCVANRARNWNRSKQSQTVGLDMASTICAEAETPVESIVCNEQLQRLRRAMAAIPYEQREVILLHIRSGLKFRAIAKLLGISANTVKSRHRYGLNKLRIVLSETEK